MLSSGAISKKGFDRLEKAFQHGRLSALRGDSCTGTALQGNVTVTSPVTPGQLLAVHEVFNLPELVEWILASLPAFDLLRTRGSYKYFRQIINSSPKIRRAMFRRGSLKTIELTLLSYGVRGVAYQIR